MKQSYIAFGLGTCCGIAGVYATDPTVILILGLLWIILWLYSAILETNFKEYEKRRKI